MTWRSAVVFVAILVFASLGVTLAGGLVVFPSPAEQIGSGLPGGPAVPVMDTDPVPAGPTPPRALVWDDPNDADSPIELALATVPPVEDRDIPDTTRSVIQSILDTSMTYPNEEEPDGNRWLPHHGIWALGLYVVGWYFWHPAGAPVFGATLVGFAVLLLLDDWISHALGIKTPGDTAFEWMMRRRTFRRMYIRLWWIIYR